MNQTSQYTPVETPAIEPLIGEREVAHILDVAEGTPGNWRRADPPAGPPYVVVEGVIRYAPSDLRAWIDTNRRDPAAMEAA